MMIVEARAAERAHLNNVILMQPLSHANELPIVAYDILYELETIGMPQLATLRRLPPEWIAENLKPNLTIKTLRDGLEKAHRWHTEGRQTQDLYADLRNIAGRSLRDYIHWYEAIDALTRQRGKFAGFLPDE